MIAEQQTQCPAEIRVFIIEDETLLRELYSEYVLVLGNYKIIGSCEDGSVALKHCLEAQPDVVILDLCLPEVSGLEILVLLKRKLPGIKVVISTGKVSGETIRRAIFAQADGFIEKTGGLKKIKNAFSAVERGERYFSPQVRKLAGLSVRDPQYSFP